LANKWQCPECKSPRVTSINDLIFCLQCGYQEYLYDYNSAYDLGYLEPKPKPVIQLRQPTPKEVIDKLHRVEVNYNDLMNRLNSHVNPYKNKGHKVLIGTKEIKAPATKAPDWF